MTRRCRNRQHAVVAAGLLALTYSAAPWAGSLATGQEAAPPAAVPDEPAADDDAAAPPAPAAPPSGRPSGASGSSPRAPQMLPAVVARINGKAIFGTQLDRAVRQSVQGRQIDVAAMPAVQAQVLEQLINKQLLEDYLSGSRYRATPEEVASAMSGMKAELEKQSATLDHVLRRMGRTEADLREETATRIALQKYLQDQLTEQALRSAFEERKPELDGTQLRVSHILLRPEQLRSDTQAQQAEATMQQAAALRERIQKGELTFADAAAQFSSGPSRRQGGDLGFIARTGPMLEAFSHAAYQLQPGEVSAPVATPFGVHLIAVTEVRPGDKTLEELRDQLRPLVSQKLLQDLIQQRRAASRIEITEGMPYLKPGTQEVIVAGQEDA